MSSARNSMLVLHVMTLRYNKKVPNWMSKNDLRQRLDHCLSNFKYVVFILYKLLFIFPPFIIVNVYTYCLYMYSKPLSSMVYMLLESGTFDEYMLDELNGHDSAAKCSNCCTCWITKLLYTYICQSWTVFGFLKDYGTICMLLQCVWQTAYN